MIGKGVAAGVEGPDTQALQPGHLDHLLLPVSHQTHLDWAVEGRAEDRLLDRTKERRLTGEGDAELIGGGVPEGENVARKPERVPPSMVSGSTMHVSAHSGVDRRRTVTPRWYSSARRRTSTFVTGMPRIVATQTARAGSFRSGSACPTLSGRGRRFVPTSETGRGETAQSLPCDLGSTGVN